MPDLGCSHGTSREVVAGIPSLKCIESFLEQRRLPRSCGARTGWVLGRTDDLESSCLSHFSEVTVKTV